MGAKQILNLKHVQVLQDQKGILSFENWYDHNGNKNLNRVCPLSKLVHIHVKLFIGPARFVSIHILKQLYIFCLIFYVHIKIFVG